VYAYLRRDGHSPEDAQDLTQEFLSRLVHKDWLAHLQDQRGRFRSFLLTFLKHFLSDQRQRAKRLKRGGGRALVSLDAFEEEDRAKFEPVDGLTADQTYERRWAQAVMAQAAARLREDYAARGKLALFDQLKDLQPGEAGKRSYAKLGPNSAYPNKPLRMQCMLCGAVTGRFCAMKSRTRSGIAGRSMGKSST
jgi:RNA polymerase sigma-70 factor (ECF subfamily)